jgi:hypothetical protein
MTEERREAESWQKEMSWPRRARKIDRMEFHHGIFCSRGSCPESSFCQAFLCFSLHFVAQVPVYSRTGKATQKKLVPFRDLSCI